MLFIELSLIAILRTFFHPAKLHKAKTCWIKKLLVLGYFEQLFSAFFLCLGGGAIFISYIAGIATSKWSLYTTFCFHLNFRQKVRSHLLVNHEWHLKRFHKFFFKRLMFFRISIWIYKVQWKGPNGIRVNGEKKLKWSVY